MFQGGLPDAPDRSVRVFLWVDIACSTVDQAMTLLVVWLWQGLAGAAGPSPWAP